MIPRYSVVIPLYNEAGNIMPLVGGTVDVLAARAVTFEIILVNDGSTDATGAEIDAAIQRWPIVRVLNLPRNRGQAAALLAGLREARAELILTMDGDGQNDPRDFERLLPAVESGALDVACGWRKERHDTRLRRSLSWLGNAVRRIVLRDPLHDGGCQLRVLRREVVNVLFPVDLLQSFLPAIALAAGFRVGEFSVRHHPRLRGKAHFGLRELWLRPAIAMFQVRHRMRTLRRARRDGSTSETANGSPR